MPRRRRDASAAPARVAVTAALATLVAGCQLFVHVSDCASDTDCPRGQVCNTARRFCQTDTAEVCGNGLDDDHDGVSDADESFGPCELASAPAGSCRDGTLRCVAGALVCRPRTARHDEVCDDGVDDDCNGVVDDSDACMARFGAVASRSPMQLGVDDPGAPDEGPAHPVCLASFALDRHEVTVQAFARFLDVVAGGAMEGTAATSVNPGATPVHGVLVHGAPYALLPPDAPDALALEHSPSEGWRPVDTAIAREPVVAVTWLGADAYCRWAGKHLPSDAEWWRASRGADGLRTNPWGEDPVGCARANVGSGGSADGGACVGAPLDVGSLPGGADPEGVEDLVGNASEWVFDWLADAYNGASNTYYATPPDAGWCGAFPGGPLGPDAGRPLIAAGADAGLLCYRCRFARGSDYATRDAGTVTRIRLDPDRATATTGFRCATGGAPR